MNKKTIDKYIGILKEELVPALGCTEPIAIAFASARAVRILGKIPNQIIVKCSGNIIKNVHSVIVPNSDGLKGIETAAILGAVGGNSDKELEVLSSVTDEDINKTKKLSKLNDFCRIELLKSEANLHIVTEMVAEKDKAIVEIVNEHTNIVREQLNDTILFEKDLEADCAKKTTDRSCLNVKDIIDFANSVDICEVQDLLSKQIGCNTKISEEGLKNSYGANVGKTLLSIGNDVRMRAKAKAAAGSDARMNGCVLPVVINSGSGNQGLTVSLPVIEYAKEWKVSDETLYRALLVSNLVAIHQKTSMGRLSAYCGAVSAACGSGAAITYMKNGDYSCICNTIKNTLANVSGIVCDGAKSSCAAKIASSVDAALMGYYMTMEKNAFKSGEGVVANEIENTIQNIGRLGRDGMKLTDVEILNIIIENQ